MPSCSPSIGKIWNGGNGFSGARANASQYGQWKHKQRRCHRGGHGIGRALMTAPMEEGKGTRPKQPQLHGLLYMFWKQRRTAAREALAAASWYPAL